jgi:hypothetical protein
MKTLFHMKRDEMVRAGRRGNATQRATVLVEGKYVDYDQMAEALGVDREKARSRYSHLKRQGKVWPITWEALRGKV